jgi:DNA invertase Pin-like site-specific DNA recombinase
MDGLRRAAAQGTKSGKAIGRPKTIDPRVEATIREALKAGASYRQAAKAGEVSLGTVQRVAAELKAAA